MKDNRDLRGCLNYNNVGIIYEDIEEVLALIEGERDWTDWHWIVKMRSGGYAYITGGCDYTGWDCESHAEAWMNNYAHHAVQCARYQYRSVLQHQLDTECAPTWDDKIGLNI